MMSFSSNGKHRVIRQPRSPSGTPARLILELTGLPFLG
jgi:hypothetical protein